MADLPTIQIEVMRYRPEQNSQPWPQQFTVPWSNETSILDALQYIKDYLDSTVTFRWSCRMAVCGSCGFVVNGEPKLGCSTFVRDYAKDHAVLRVGPLENFDIEKDLVVDIEPFITKLESVKPYIIRTTPAPPTTEEFLQTPAQLAKFKNLSMCINCLLCYSACPQVGLNQNFLGPAAFAIASRYNADSRDQGAKQRDPTLFQPDGAWPCTFVGYCSEVCPKHVDPAASIQQGKSRGMQFWLAELLPKPSKKSKAET